MASEFKLPELGENVHGGDVLRVLVKAGDSVTVDQPVLELETDKATIEVPSSIAGTVKGVSVKAGEKGKVGQTTLVLGEAAAPPSGNGGSPAKPEAGSREPEAGSGQPEAGSRQPEAGSREPEAVSREP